MTQNFDPYAILGVAPSASAEDIRRIYSQLTSRINRRNQVYGNAATDQLYWLTQAYNLLVDPVHRRNYDERIRSSDLYFTMRVVPSKSTVIPLPEEQVIYLLADIIPSPAARKIEERETHLNLTLVIDHSKSMEDEKRMEKVKAAVQTIVTELSSDDVISVVAFNDWSSVIIPATPVQDKMGLRARVSMIQPKGGTEIFKGLSEGVKQVRKHLSRTMVNHIILLTDGRTYGVTDQCLALAKEIASQGIAISAMGLGTDWNDVFLDQLASTTGGSTTFIKSGNMVARFLDDQVRNLSNAFAERVQLSIVPDPGVELEMAFKLSPNPQPLSHEGGIIHLGTLQGKRPVSVLLQFQLPRNIQGGYRSIARMVASGDIMPRNAFKHHAVSYLQIEVNQTPTDTEGPPASIIDALSKLTLYQMQEKAQQALKSGDIAEATRCLQFLATRLIDMGQPELGRQAMAEAQHVSQTRAFSNDASGKTMKYSTRALIEPGAIKEAQHVSQTWAFSNDVFDWCGIPAGSVILRGDSADPDDDYALSNQEVYVSAFAIAKYPITNAQFAKFIEAGGYQNQEFWTKAGWELCQSGSRLSRRGRVDSGKPWTEPLFWHVKQWDGADYPVVGVSWYEAYAFCRWLSAASGEGISLPTEHQWQLAAQGAEKYPVTWENSRLPVHLTHPGDTLGPASCVCSRALVKRASRRSSKAST